MYIDGRRLSAYVEQIAASPKVREKAQELAVELSVTGPKASMKQPEILRDPTVHEKVTIFRRWLERSPQMRRGRPRDESPTTPFVIERCAATRVSVPEKAGDSELPAFSFWVSDPKDPDSGHGLLLLLEDFSAPDVAPTSFRGYSTYTILQSLVFFTRGKIESSVLGVPFESRPHPNPYARFAEKPPSLGEFHNVKEHVTPFLGDMASFVRHWRCLVSPPRQIDAIYRIREYGREAGTTWQRVSVFGYPIVITAT